ncbi:Zinc-binding protein A33 [Liparis tanakae]|uniref:Zinc-binding protein A33 n=1 Tax=Liparis tanakae TaxID=230148 RepID=A0A4Z2HB03_9TELE|nr:Zinc-binding protein A33 [Liparis tanakae]
MQSFHHHAYPHLKGKVSTFHLFHANLLLQSGEHQLPILPSHLPSSITGRRQTFSSSVRNMKRDCPCSAWMTWRLLENCVKLWDPRLRPNSQREHMKKDFESLHRFLSEEEAAMLLAPREEQEEMSGDEEEQIERMNQMIKSLEVGMQSVEEELDAGGDGVGYLELTNQSNVTLLVYERALTGHREPQKGCAPLIDVAKHLGNLQYAEWEKMRRIAPAQSCPLTPLLYLLAPVTLEPRTASRSRRVSPGLTGVHIAPGASRGLLQQSHPHSCILAREGFDSGEPCWDIEVSRAV